MSNKIENQINYYIKNNTCDGALIIDGEYKSGKTHFIKEFMAENYSKNSVYINLNGKATIEEIYGLINFSIVTRHSVSLDVVNEYNDLPDISNYIKTGKISVKKTVHDVSELISLAKLKLREYILVFDDIEKCHCNLQEVFNLFNQLIEQTQAKIIVIINTNRIKDEATYKLLEETVSGTRIVYKSNFRDNVNYAVSKEKKNGYPYFKTIKDDIISFSKYFGEEQLTVLYSFINKGKMLTDSIDKKYNIYYSNILNYAYKSYIAKENRSWNDDALFGTVCFNKLNNKSLFDDITCDGFKFVDDFLYDDDINEDEIAKTMQEYDKYVVTLSEELEIEALKKWQTKDDKNILSVLEKIKNKLSKNKYQFSLYPTIIDYLCKFKTIGLLKANSYKEFETIMVDNVKNSDVIAYNWLDRNSKKLASNEYSKTIKKLLKIVKEKNIQNETSILNKILDNKDWANKLHNYYLEKINNNPKYSTTYYYDTNKLVKTISNSDNSNLFIFIQLLKEELSKDNQTIDINKLKELQTKLSQIVCSQKDAIAEYNISVIIELLSRKLPK